MIRILHVMAYPPWNLGGVEKFVENLLRHLNQKDVYNEIICTDLKENRNYTKEYQGTKVNVRKHYINLWGKNPLFEIFRFLLAHKQDFDIIHVHSYFYFSSLQAIQLSKMIKKPVILTLHGGIQTESMGNNSFLEKMQLFIKKYFFDPVWGKLVIEPPQILTSVSRGDLMAISRVFRIKRQRGNYWIPNGVDTDRFYPSSKEGTYILFIGRLSYIKGFDIFMEIAKEIKKRDKSIKIMVIGQGELKYLIEQNSELNIEYYPRVPYSKIREYYHASRIYVNTSRFEGLPTTILEAMASGIPIVASAVGGIPDVVKDERNGLLFKIEKNSYGQIAEKIIALYNDKQKRENLRTNALETIEKKYKWTAISQDFYMLYRLLLKQIPPIDKK